jgi:TonB family protein
VPEGGWLSLTSKDANYTSYFSEIKEAIKQNWKTPEIAFSGQFSVGFTINRNGQIEEMGVRHSSGSRILDQEAMRAIKAASPFPPLPSSINANSISISASMYYRSRLPSLKELLQSPETQGQLHNSPSLEFD